MTENRFSDNQIKRKPDALLIGMQARHKRVDPHESEHYQYERDAGHPGHFSSAPFHPQPQLQKVDQACSAQMQPEKMTILSIRKPKEINL